MNVLAWSDRSFAGLASRCRNVYYRLRGVRLSGYVWIRAIEVPRNFSDIEIAPGVSLDRGVTLLCGGPSCGRPKLVIGAGTYVNRYTIFDAIEELVIGADCAIGPGCYLTDHDHDWQPGRPPLQLAMTSKATRIGNRVWLGANVIVLKGVRIGDDSVVGAGSVVTKNIPCRTLAVGVPAKPIRSADRLGEIL